MLLQTLRPACAAWLFATLACATPQAPRPESPHRQAPEDPYEVAVRAYTAAHGACETRDRVSIIVEEQPPGSKPLAEHVPALSACFDATSELTLSVVLRDDRAELAPDQPSELPPPETLTCVLNVLREAQAARPADGGALYGFVSRLGSRFDPVPMGLLPKAAIRAVIETELEDVRKCYEDALVWWPHIHGRVVTRFVIEPNGSIQSAVVVRHLEDLELVGCGIVHAIRRWSMPKPMGGRVIVDYPFNLETR